MKSVVVVGGGFKGIIGAYLLKEKGFDVTLIEKSPFLGGIMRSAEWGEFYVDNGVQLFDSIPKSLFDIVNDVLDGDVLPVDFNYASVFNGKTTEGLAIPNYEHLDKKTKESILFEMVSELVTPKSKVESLLDKMLSRYGPTASKIMNASMRSIYGVDAHNVEADSMRQTMFHRIRFLPDAMALELKKHPILDDRIAAKRAAIGKVDDFISVYPGKGGMRGFCEKMHQRLNNMGVKVILGQGVEDIHINNGTSCTLQLQSDKIQADHLFWGNDHALLAQSWKHDNSLAKATHLSAMVVFYFRVAKQHIHDFTYFNQFTPNALVFRAAAAGLYSQQEDNNGNSFISVECPALIGGELWEHSAEYSERVFKECIAFGMLDEHAVSIGEPLIRRAPVTHRFPKRGNFDLCERLDVDISNSKGVILMPKKEAFSRREIMFSIEETLAEL